MAGQMSAMIDHVELLLGSSLHILHMYLFGSRAYFGLDHSSSDFDVMVIVSDVEFSNDVVPWSKECFRVNSGKQFQRCVQSLRMEDDTEYNISIYSQSVFERLVEEHSIFIMFCVYSHETCGIKLKENLMGTETPAVYYYCKYFQKHKLVVSVLNEVHRAWQKAFNKLTKENDVKKGLKLIVYCFRFLAWGEELLDKGMIHDSVSEGNDLYWELIHMVERMDSKSDGCEVYKQTMLVVKEQYAERVSNFTSRSEYSVRYPQMSPVTSRVDDVKYSWLDTNSVGKYLDELCGVSQSFGSVQSLMTLFSIGIEKKNENLIELKTLEQGKSDKYPMAACCRDGIGCENGESGHLVFKYVPPIASLKLVANSWKQEWNVNDIKDGVHVAVYEKSANQLFIYWDEVWKCTTQGVLHKLPKLVGNHELEKGEVCAIVLKGSMNGCEVIGRSSLQTVGGHLQFSQRVYENVSSHIALTIPDTYRDNTDGLVDYLSGCEILFKLFREQRVEQVDMVIGNEFIEVSSPLHQSRHMISNFMNEYSDCFYKNVDQLPEFIMNSCYDFTKWGGLVDEIEIKHSLVGNASQLLVDLITSIEGNISKVAHCIMELYVETYKEDMKMLDQKLKISFPNTSKKNKHVSLLKGILIALKKRNIVEMVHIYHILSKTDNKKLVELITFLNS